MNLKKPDFIIIGAAKAGTTSLYRYMIRHPAIIMSTPKEPSYFAFDERYARGEDWYLSLFANSAEGKLCGEASTNYTNWPLYPHTADRMRRLLPDIKFLYIMRHPVDRAYSHYLQLIDNIRHDDPDFKFADTFEQHIEKDDSPIQSSNYMVQLSQFLNYYTRDQFLFLLFEDFINSPKETLSQVIAFLNLDQEIDLTKAGHLTANVNKDKEAWLIRSQLTAPLKALPGAQWIADVLPKGVRDIVYKVLHKTPMRRRIEADFIPPKMRPETRARLVEYFRRPNLELSEFLGKELSHWNR